MCPVSPHPNLLIYDDSIYFVDITGNFYRISLEDGRIICKGKLKSEFGYDEFFGAVTAYNGKILSASKNGMLYLISPDCQIIWSKNMGIEIPYIQGYNPDYPVLNNLFIINSEDSKAFDIEKKDVIWSRKEYISVIGEKLFIKEIVKGHQEGEYYYVDEFKVCEVNPLDGTDKNCFYMKERIEYHHWSVEIKQSPGYIWLFFGDGELDGLALHVPREMLILDSELNPVRRYRTSEVAPFLNGIWCAIDFYLDDVLVSSCNKGTEEGDNSFFYVFSLTSGKIWEYNTKEDTISHLIFDDIVLLIHFLKNTSIAKYIMTGQELWRRPLPLFLDIEAYGGKIYVLDLSGLSRIDLKTGSTDWEIKLDIPDPTYVEWDCKPAYLKK